jgi:hypothetical protein
MKDIATFASEERPLHPSGLRTVLSCSWRSAMEHIYTHGDGESGAAADTGSAMHAAAAHMHRGFSVSECISHMHSCSNDYPRADLNDAVAMFLSYAADTRNQVEVRYVEQPIAFNIAPAPHDPTGLPIHIIGTMDQVRVIGGKLYLWDIKTSKRDPMDVIYETMFQAAAYCIGGTILAGTNVLPGGIITPRKYGKKGYDTAPTHHPFHWSFADIESILEPVRNTVAMVRSGKLYHMPTADCKWCHQRTPELCLPKLQQYLKLRKESA